MIQAVFVIPIIRSDYIAMALETLHKNTHIELRTIVVDQTKDGLFSDPELWKRVDPLTDMYLRPNRNLGFAKAMNEGIIHGLHWGAKYVVASNDDVEFIDPRWWDGILEQFKEFPEMMAVNPASIIEPGWGYGIGQKNFECPDWGVVVDKEIYPKKEDGTPFTYEDTMAEGGYDWLTTKYKQGHIEGFAGWMVVGKREMWETVGLYDERFTPGGGEDYHLCHRIYLEGGRASATMRSWVWHWWGKSREIVHKEAQSLMPVNRPTWANVDSLFKHSPNGVNSPIYPPRENEPYNNKRKSKSLGIFIDDIR